MGYKVDKERLRPLTGRSMSANLNLINGTDKEPSPRQMAANTLVHSKMEVSMVRELCPSLRDPRMLENLRMVT